MTIGRRKAEESTNGIQPQLPTNVAQVGPVGAPQTALTSDDVWCKELETVSEGDRRILPLERMNSRGPREN